MLLMIDNYDSFTYNLVQYFGELGQEVRTFRNDQITIEEIKKIDPKYIVISPGPCTPKESGISMQVIESFKENKPILGVCLGHQAIGAVFGANIIKAKELMHGKTSEILHEGNYLFQDMSKNFIATRYHSLVIEEKTLSKDFIINARTKDGSVMGIQHSKLNVSGVQFHPESIMTEDGKKLLSNFLIYVCSKFSPRNEICNASKKTNC